MIIILSPSKSINFNNSFAGAKATAPLFERDAEKLMHKLARFRAEEIMKLEKLSAKLALSAYEFFQTFSINENQKKPALFAFDGNVYDKLLASTLDQSTINFAQQHLFIFSALYGLLKPLDQIRPYRLDMNSKLIPELYAYWREKVSLEVKSALTNDDNVLINLASAEYFKMINTRQLNRSTHIITPIFQQEIKGKLMTNSLFAKHARGLMTRFILENRLSDPEHLKAFDSEGYFYNPHLSKGDHWHFTR